MIYLKRFVLMVISLASCLLFALPMSAQQNQGDKVTVLYVHGFFVLKNNVPQIINCHLWASERCEGNNDYWKGMPESSTTEKRLFVAYDATLNPLSSGPTRGFTRLLEGLNMYCRRDREQRCRIVAHSMGGLTTGYTVAQIPDILDFYNIEYIQVLAGGQGGSEAADTLPTLEKVPGLGNIIKDFLSTDAAHALPIDSTRGAYTHDLTRGIPFYNVFGKEPDVDQGALKFLFPPHYDGIIAPHSACNFTEVGLYDRCTAYTLTTCSEDDLRKPSRGVLELVKGVADSLRGKAKPLACPSGAAKEEVERVLFDGNHPHPNFNVMGEDIGHSGIKDSRDYYEESPRNE